MERFDSTHHQYEKVSSREEQLAKLEKTEGWAHLTKKQQAMILASLSLQCRHDLRKNPYSIQRTRKVVRDWFCNYAVRSLEREDVMDFGLFRDLIAKGETREFFGDYFEDIPWQEGSCNVTSLGQEEFPQVLYIGKVLDDIRYPEGDVQTYHSCLVLGKGDGEDLLVWEKMEEKKPFALSNLQDVLARYPKSDRFAYRPLDRVGSEGNESEGEERV